MPTHSIWLEETIDIFAWALEYPISLSESYSPRDDLNSYYLLDQNYFSPLTEFRTGATQKIATFSIPKKQGYVLQKTGLDAKKLSLVGFIFSTEAEPEDRDAKRQMLERAFKSNSPVRFAVEGEGTFEAILTGLTFEDIGGEPNAYRYAIEALEIGYADYSDHSNINHVNSSPHTNYAHSDHVDHNDSSHTNHGDHSDVAHSDSYPHTDSHGDSSVFPWTDHGIFWNDQGEGKTWYHYDYSDAIMYKNLKDYQFVRGWSDFAKSSFTVQGNESHHGDYLDFGYGSQHEGHVYLDYTDHQDTHTNWSDHSNVAHEDYTHDDIGHGDWLDYVDMVHSNWSNHQDGYEDWNNHTDSGA